CNLFLAVLSIALQLSTGTADLLLKGVAVLFQLSLVAFGVLLKGGLLALPLGAMQFLFVEQCCSLDLELAGDAASLSARILAAFFQFLKLLLQLQVLLFEALAAMSGLAKLALMRFLGYGQFVLRLLDARFQGAQLGCPLVGCFVLLRLSLGE